MDGPGYRQVPSMNHLLQAELALTHVEQIGFGQQVGMTRQGQRRLMKQEEGLTEQATDTMKRAEGEDQTSSTPSRDEGDETMDADPWEQQPMQESGEDDEKGGDTDHHDEFNGDIESSV